MGREKKKGDDNLATIDELASLGKVLVGQGSALAWKVFRLANLTGNAWAALVSVITWPSFPRIRNISKDSAHVMGDL